MRKNNEISVEEWRMLEAEKKAQVDELRAKRKAIMDRNAENLLQAGMGDKAAGVAVVAGRKEISDIDIEIEGLQAALAVIPDRINARFGYEIEQCANEAENILASSRDVFAEIDRTAEAFVLSLGKYWEVQESIKKVSRSQKTYLPDPMQAFNHFCKVHAVRSPLADVNDPRFKSKTTTEAVYSQDDAAVNGTFVNRFGGAMSAIRKAAAILQKKEPGWECQACHTPGSMTVWDDTVFGGTGGLRCNKCGSPRKAYE